MKSRHVGGVLLVATLCNVGLLEWQDTARSSGREPSAVIVRGSVLSARPSAASLSTAARSRPGKRHWQVARVTAYSADREWLTGCTTRNGRKICETACGQALDDRKFSVAANPRLALACGSRIRVLKWDGNRMLRATAVVNDRTGSSFDFEFSVALATATGASGAAWDAPRWVSWQPVGER